MPVTSSPARSQVWMDTLGDWSWPGTSKPAELMPPPWVPASPARREPVAVLAGAGHAAAVPARRRTRPWRVAVALFTSVAAALATGIAVQGPGPLERLVGLEQQNGAVAARFATVPVPPPAPLPTLVAQSSDSAGSAIDSATYHSPALGGNGLFYVYLPPGYSTSTARYPVIYLLPGNSQPAEAFLQIGLQGTLDELIGHHVIAPMIAVMIHGGPGANNWHNEGRVGYENYVLEVQQLVDRMLPTIPERNARAIAGDSMGGYGAMNIALGNPFRFAVVESWIAFFNGLSGELRADRSVIHRLGLRAYVYGVENDKIANPAEDAPFAEALRANGAIAHSALYPGEHSLQTVEAHLAAQLTYAGRALAAETAAARARAARAEAPLTRHPAAGS
jgi:hypothetical protein